MTYSQVYCENILTTFQPIRSHDFSWDISIPLFQFAHHFQTFKVIISSRASFKCQKLNLGMVIFNNIILSKLFHSFSKQIVPEHANDIYIAGFSDQILRYEWNYILARAPRIIIIVSFSVQISSAILFSTAYNWKIHRWARRRSSAGSRRENRWSLQFDANPESIRHEAEISTSARTDRRSRKTSSIDTDHPKVTFNYRCHACEK